MIIPLTSCPFVYGINKHCNVKSIIDVRRMVLSNVFCCMSMAHQGKGLNTCMVLFVELVLKSQIRLIECKWQWLCIERRFFFFGRHTQCPQRQRTLI